MLKFSVPAGQTCRTGSGKLIFQPLNRVRPVAWFAVGWLLCAAAPNLAKTLYERDSAYHHILVKDEGNYRILYFDNSTESRMALDDPYGGAFEYTEYFHIPFLFNENIRQVLCIGLGGGSIPKQFVHDYPNVQVDVVDVDKHVIEVAKKFFQVQPGPRLNLIESDGRVYIRRTRKIYDVIMLDAYTTNRYGSTVPFHLTTREFFEQVAEHLSPNGIVVYNSTGSETNQMTRALYKTMGVLFPQQYLFDVETSLNTVLIALRKKVALTPEQLVQRAEELVRRKVIKRPYFVRRVKRVYTEPVETDDVPLLTDGRAPVDSLLANRWRGR